MTPQEKHLWYDYLADYPVKIQRQKPVLNFIADFYCASARLVIELDGSQHYTEDGKAYDAERTEALENLDIIVLRFSNREVDTDFPNICQAIDRTIKGRL